MNRIDSNGTATAVADPAPPATLRSPPTAKDVARWLKAIIDPDQVVELRIPKVYIEVFGAGRLAELARVALEHSGKVPGVYFTLNPVAPHLAGGSRSARDGDITCRRRLLIDFDPDRPADTPATDAEKADALAALEACRDFLRSLGWPAPVEADSGNGYHLLYAIDLPNDDASKALVRAVLRALAARFDSPVVKVDTGVFNASRICKLYGTEAKKGPHSAERPHRFSRVLKVPRAFTPVPRELLEALTATPSPVPAKGKPHSQVGDRARPADGTTILSIDARLDRARKYLAPCDPAISGQRGHDRAFKIACKIGPGFDLPPDVAFALLRDEYNPRCEPPFSEAELWHKVVDSYKTEGRGFLLEAPRSRTRSNGRAHPPGDGDGDDDGQVPSRVGGDDLPVNEAPDDPHRLARAVLAEFRHRDGPTLAWYREAFHVWDGAAYRVDPSLAHRFVALVKADVDRRNRLALAEHREGALAAKPGRPSPPPVATRVTRRLISDVLQALASLTCIDHEPNAPFWIRPRPGDPDPASLMPAANGLVDLDAAGGPALLPDSPRLFSTYALPYAYDPAAPPPAAWLKFLDDLWADDPASVRELQKWFGYALTPRTEQQKMLLLIGPTRSGRSTIRKALTAVVGGRNVAATSAVAMAHRFGLQPLLGKTLAVMGDARTPDAHDAAVLIDRLLRISGEDPVEVDRKNLPILPDVQMRTRLVIVSNEMPNFRDASGAIVGRYLVLRTPISFEGREDRTLERKLLGVASLPGLLNWSIAGRVMLGEDGGFKNPETAADLLDDARALASPPLEFVAERCRLDPDEEATVDALWAEWKLWTADNGHLPGHKSVFARNLLTALGTRIKKVRPREDGVRSNKYAGIGLNKDAPRY